MLMTNPFFQVMKAYPSPEDLRKRMSMKRTQEIISNNGTGAPPKKMKIETTPVQEENSQPSTESTLDSMEAWILSRLTPQIAAELVAVSLVSRQKVKGIFTIWMGQMITILDSY